jgi:GLPGLI family protein
MLKRIFFFPFFLASFIAKAQSTDTALVAVRYTFHYVMDTTQPADIVSENMVLFIGEKTSVFRSHDKYLRDSVLRVQFEKQVLTPGGTNSIVSPQGMKVGSSTAFYKDPASNKLNQLELLMKFYLIGEDMPVIDWKVTSETKNIHDLPCQKATANFRGRNYTAWFCSQLPYSNGPWKLGGLPGLIVEAEDEKKEVVFSFDSFENVSNRGIVITLPGNAVPTSKKDFVRLREAATNNPQSMVNNAGGGDLALTVKRAGGPTVSAPVKKKVNNNPIERGNN